MNTLPIEIKRELVNWVINSKPLSTTPLHLVCKEFNTIINTIASENLDQANNEICEILPALKPIVAKKTEQQTPPTPQKLFMILYNNVWDARCSVDGEEFKVQFPGPSLHEKMSWAYKMYQSYALEVSASFTNRDKVLAAVKINGDMLKHASAELQKDEKIIQEAELQKKRALNNTNKKETLTTRSLRIDSNIAKEAIELGHLKKDDVVRLKSGSLFIKKSTYNKMMKKSEEPVQECATQ